MDFYNDFMKDAYRRWEENKGWKRNSQAMEGYDVTAMKYNGTDNLSYQANYGLASDTNVSDGAFYTGTSAHMENGDVSLSHSQAGRTVASTSEEDSGGYALDICRETEALLQTLQVLCQDVVQSGETLKQKPDILKCIMK